MLYLADTPSHSRMLAKRVERGTLIRLAQGIYSDDRVRSAEEQVRAAVGHQGTPHQPREVGAVAAGRVFPALRRAVAAQ